MREFVYISERKLAQFVPDRASLWRRMRLAKISGSVGVAQTKLGFETSADASATAPRTSLDAVIEHLEADARWFADDEVMAGTWVCFDSLLYLATIWMAPHRTGAAVFVEIDGGGHDDAGDVGDVAAAPGARPRLLFLHGAADHLLGAAASSVEWTRAPSAAGGARHGGQVSFTLTPQTWEDLAFGLGYRPAPSARLPGQVEIEDLATVRRVLDWMFSTLARNPYCRGQAAWMAGAARVTSVVDMGGYDVVTASPLYVERVPPPEDA